MATGRTDYPNQVNNVLCFPYIFRGALDAGASTITTEMEIAAVHAIAELAQAEQSEVVAAAYAGETLAFGPEYLIPKPFDPRLMMKIAPAVVQAAIDSGVAKRPVADMDAYREKLQSLVYASGAAMKPVFSAAKRGTRKRICFSEGEEERVLRAAQIVLDEGLAQPILIGRPSVIQQRIERFGLRLTEGVDYQVVNVENDHRYRDFWQTYHRMTERKGVTQQLAKIDMRRRLTLIGCMMVHKGEADGLICGTWSTPDSHLHYVDQVIGLRPGVSTYACMNALLLPERQVFLVDTHINYDPSAEQLAEITIMAAEEIRRAGSVAADEPVDAQAMLAALGSAPWPRFRGPRGDGTSACTELLWIDVGGPAAHHLASIVPPLSLHDLPTLLWWDAPIDATESDVRQLLRGVDRVIVDGATQPGNGLATIRTLAHVAGSAGVALTDFALLRQGRWRDSIATMFDDEQAAPFLGAINAISIDYAKGNVASTATNVVRPAYHVAWLASRIVAGIGVPMISAVMDCAEAAARHYFRKSAAQLSPWEAARLRSLRRRSRRRPLDRAAR